MSTQILQSDIIENPRLNPVLIGGITELSRPGFSKILVLV